MSKDWNTWTPATPLAKWMQDKFIQCDLWEQEELFALLPETEGLTRNDFFREEMYDNEDWPWTTFKADTRNKGLKLKHRYMRRRASWNPVIDNDNIKNSEDPRVWAAKQVLMLIDMALTHGPTLSTYEKHSKIVIGILVRLRDRVRNELERLQNAERINDTEFQA